MRLHKIINRVRNPISKDTEEFIEYLYDIEDNGRPIGRVRFEIYNNLLFVTPIPITARLKDIKFLKSEVIRLGIEVMDKFYYDVAFVYTKNKKMIEVFKIPNLKFAELTHDGYYVYFIEREDL